MGMGSDLNLLTEDPTAVPRITHVAIRCQGKVWSLPPPNRHHDVIRLICKEAGVASAQVPPDDRGFLIDGETYVRRKPALLVARKSGQIKPGSLGLNLGELYSEDVW